MKKVLLSLLVALFCLQLQAQEKQIYGKVEYKNLFGDSWGKNDWYYSSYEYSFQLTLYYGVLPDEGIYYTINKTTGIPQWKGLTCESSGIHSEYNRYDSRLSLVYFDKSMLDAVIVSTSHWFENMSELKFVYGLENLNMSYVSDMSYMFAGCTQLRCIDMSRFQFTAATNTTKMFDGCSSMKYINAPASLSKVNNESLFYGVGSRTTPCDIETPDGYDYQVDISGSYFLYKSGYFKNCDNEAYYIFQNYYDQCCSYNLNLRYDKKSTFINTLCSYPEYAEEGSRFTELDFFYFSLLKYSFDDLYIDDIWTKAGSSKINKLSISSMYGEVDAFNDLSISVVVDSSFSKFRPNSTSHCFAGLVTNYFENFYYNENPYDNDHVDFLHFLHIHLDGLNYINTSEVKDMSGMFYGAYIEDWDFKNFDTSSATDMSSMFRNSYYSDLDLSNINTSNVTDMSYMFSGCYYLKSLDLSSFNTSKVNDMSYMFSFGIGTNLTDLNLSSFDMTNVKNTEAMLYGCSSLRNLWISSTMDKLDEGACEGIGTAADPCVIHAPEGFNFGVDTSGDYFIWKSGYFRLPDTPVPYVALSEDKKTLKFIYDNKRPEYDGITYLVKDVSSPEWLENKQSITKVVFDGTFKNAHPKTTSNWFSGMSNLKTIEGLDNLNTANVVSYYNMFNGCSSITSLDISNLNISNVTSMQNMFNGCSFLTSLDISGLDTSNVTNISGMFSGCNSLTSLDLSSFNTSKATNMSGMFQGCSGLKTLKLSNSDTSSATNMNSMFKGCSSLESLDLSKFTIGENTQTSEMMSGCFALNRLLISSTMNRLEPDACLGVGTTTSPCEIKAPSGFDYGVSTSGDFFRWKGGCFAITSEEYANISSDGTTITFYCDGKRSSRSGTTYNLQLSGKPDWSAQATTITKAVIDPSFSFARPVTVRSWFEGMKNLKVIEGIENLNTSEAEYTSYMFQNCSSIETLDLSHFDTSKVKMMGAMFKGCSSLKSVDISNFDSGICTSLNSMFYGCNKLTSLDLSALTINESADSRSMLNGCTALEELTIPESAGNLNSTAFTTVGTSDAPCILHAPEGFDFGTDTGSAFQWKGGWFVLHTPAKITASVASLSPGNAAQLIVRMNNGMASSYNGFEMVVRLPEGMSLAKKGNDFNCKLGERCSGMSVSVSDLGNGTYRIMGYSLSNATISGTEGALLLLSISCPENVPVGSYTGTLEDISLSTTAGTGEEPDDVIFPITVSQYRMGDVDLNGKVNVIDVMLVVSHILGDKLNNFHAEYADIDGNGKINVLDVTTIIDVILNSPYMSQQAPERVSHTTHLTQLPASGGVVLALDGTERFTACQMDVRLDGGAMLRGVKLLGGNASSHSVKYSRISDDMWRVVVYSAKGSVLENGAPLLQLLTDGKGNAIIENIEMCSELFESVTPECIEGSATAITEAGTDIQEVLTYTIQGIRIAKPQRGVNIRKGAKVTVK